MAYTTATLVRKDDPLDDGRVWITVAFTGNAGEPTVRQRYLVGPNDTGQSIRQWAIAIAENLGSTKNIADNLTVGQSVNLTPIPPPANPVPTAREVWQGKVGRYRVFAALGPWSGAMATALTALKTDIEGTYQDGFI